MTIPYDFSWLTDEQRELLTTGGWKWSKEMPAEPSYQAVDGLIARRLLKVLYDNSSGRSPYGRERRGLRRSLVVPPDVAIAWAAFLKAESGTMP